MAPFRVHMELFATTREFSVEGGNLCIVSIDAVIVERPTRILLNASNLVALVVHNGKVIDAHAAVALRVENGKLIGILNAETSDTTATLFIHVELFHYDDTSPTIPTNRFWELICVIGQSKK